MNYIFAIFLFCVEAKVTKYVSNVPIRQIGSRFYREELLTDKFQDPRELTYDSSSRHLFFTYMDDELQNSGRGHVNVVTKETKKIVGIARNKAIGVDLDTGDVYFGSDDGLYKFDPVFNNATLIGLYNINIMKIVIRNNEIYVLDANNHGIYKVKNTRKANKVGEWKTVMVFDVDYSNNLHFVNICGLFCVPNGAEEAVKNENLPLVYHFLIDEQKTFGITLDSLYEIDCQNGTARKVADIDFYIRSITFGDYGDIYYSTDVGLFRLKPINHYVMFDIKRSRT
ncbi:uncharacterized protein LOC134658778 [Cydia amplana]|uniref:uncharacterized protein LOC134658778 n=1 Tax=Cydia amplana TaxID=1869771 RepID=UPI002FE57C95